uniref:Uncharacterized protein n=1 Tax=Anguilla anguilla TaxID=7936 RepID=A0A0E9VTT6_ANGAN
MPYPKTQRTLLNNGHACLREHCCTTLWNGIRRHRIMIVQALHSISYRFYPITNRVY